MRKAKSRLPHNHKKKRLNNIFGGYFYVTIHEGRNTVLALTSSVLIGFLLYVSGNRQVVRATSMVSPYVGQLEAVEQAEPTPTPIPTVEQYIKHVFGEDSEDAFKILECENKTLNPNAINHNRNGSIDEGIFQINSIHRQKDMKNWRKNIDYAKKIFDRQGWSPWSCSHKVGVTPFYLINK